jgi:hypothetical protein
MRSTDSLSRLAIELPAVVAADEGVPFELSFTEQRALMRTTPLEDSQRRAGTHGDERDSSRREDMRTVTDEVGEPSRTLPAWARLRCHRLRLAKVRPVPHHAEANSA